MKITEKGYKDKWEIVTELFWRREIEFKRKICQNMSREDKLKLKKYGKGIRIEEKWNKKKISFIWL